MYAEMLLAGKNRIKLLAVHANPIHAKVLATYFPVIDFHSYTCFSFLPFLNIILVKEPSNLHGFVGRRQADIFRV